MIEIKGFDYYNYEVGREKYVVQNTKLVWNVFTYNINLRKIEIRNIFEYSWRFAECIYWTYKEHKDDYKQFCEQIRHDIMYCYWSKCEYEIGVCDPFHCEGLIKTDVSLQIMMNWDRFITYLWENKDKIKKLAKELGLK